jgi:hypothetical protein
MHRYYVRGELKSLHSQEPQESDLAIIVANRIRPRVLSKLVTFHSLEATECCRSEHSKCPICIQIHENIIK